MGRLRRVLSGKPVHPVGEDGKMALSDHFRELRARLMRSLLALVSVFSVALFFNRDVIEAIVKPYEIAARQLPEHVKSEIFAKGLAVGILLPLTVSAVVAVVATAPFWLYQIWAFILPGLHAHERKWSRVFAAVAGPLFIAGVALATYLMPQALSFMIALVPENFTQRIDFNDYLSFLWRTALAFGLAFQVPVFVVLLNRVGMLSVAAIKQSRTWVILGSFIFAAIATPTGDPFTLLALAVPMWVLFEIAAIICRFLERRDRKRAPAGA